MCACEGSLEPRHRCALANATHRLPIGDVLAEIQLSHCLRQCISGISTGTSPVCACEESSERRRRCALSDATHRMSNGGLLAEIYLMQCLRTASAITQRAHRRCARLVARQNRVVDVHTRVHFTAWQSAMYSHRCWESVSVATVSQQAHRRCARVTAR
jgi:hypothetical protein